MGAPITLNDILAVLRQGDTRDLSDYKTVEEWADHFGVRHEERIRRAIRDGQRLGIVDHQRGRRPAIDGRLSQINLYAFNLKGRDTDTSGGADPPKNEGE